MMCIPSHTKSQCLKLKIQESGMTSIAVDTEQKKEEYLSPPQFQAVTVPYFNMYFRCNASASKDQVSCKWAMKPNTKCM